MLWEGSASVPDDYIIPVIYESRSGAKPPLRIIFAGVAGGIGDFTVATVKDGAEGQARTAGDPRPARIPGRGNSHYVLLLNRGWEQDGPVKFHNGYLDELRGRFRLAAKVPLPEMPDFFPPGAEGEMTVIPRGVSHQNVGHGPNIEITIYARKPLKRLCPTDAEEARKRMKVKDGKPVVPPVTLDDPET